MLAPGSPVRARNILIVCCLFVGSFALALHDWTPSGFLAKFRPMELDGEGGLVFKDTYVVPVDSGEAGHYLRIAVTIEIRTEADRTMLTEQNARVRDALIALSADCSPAELQGRVGMERTKHMMREALRTGTPDVAIGGVYFSEFLVR
jgi:hypothetical protein